jgi:hypothetical protein
VVEDEALVAGKAHGDPEKLVDVEAAADGDRRWRSAWRHSQPKGNGGEVGCPMAVGVLEGMGEHHGSQPKLARLVVKWGGGRWRLLSAGLPRQMKVAAPVVCKAVFDNLLEAVSQATVGSAGALCPGPSAAADATWRHAAAEADVALWISMTE